MATIQGVASRVSRHTFGDLIVGAVYLLILLVTVGGWTFAGFLVWVPLLIRTTTLLAAAVLYANLFGEPERVARAEQALRFAVRFYLNGFEHFIGFYRHRHDDTSQKGILPLSEIRWKEMVVQCVWIVAAWAIVYVSLHSLVSRLLLALER